MIPNKKETSVNRPNILWLCTDQQRYDTLGITGNKIVRTPNIDNLAQHGMTFDRCFCQTPICTPSRASFLTGRYPRTTRCRQNGQSIPADELLITRLLADEGYTCGLAGKLHLSYCEPSVAKTIEQRIDDGYAEFHWSHGPAPDHPTNDYIHWLREKGVEYQQTPCEESKYVQVGMPPEHHQTTWCAQKAINFIEAHADSNQPWLFSFNCFDPHHPFDPPEAYLERYLDLVDDIPLPHFVPGELDEKPAVQRADHHGAYNIPGYLPAAKMTDRDHRLIRAAYWAMVDLVDDQVGRIMHALEQTGQLDNTIVIFMSDHGEMLGDHGIYLKGPYFYDPLIQVPLIMSWPGHIVEGMRSSALIELVDLVPTLLDAVTLEHPPGVQGRSFWHLLIGEHTLDHHRDDVYSEFYNSGAKFNPLAHMTMVRTAQHKLVCAHGTEPGELYDLVQDPNETSNLWHDATYRSVKVDMLQRLCDRMAWTVDPLPVRQAPW